MKTLTIVLTNELKQALDIVNKKYPNMTPQQMLFSFAEMIMDWEDDEPIYTTENDWDEQ